MSKTNGQPPQASVQDVIKLGHIVNGDIAPVDYGLVWERQQTTGPEVLLIAASRTGSELMLDLAREHIPESFVLYVLLLSRCSTHEPGRYQSPCPLVFDELRDFFKRFGPYFDTDGRHHVWIGSPESPNQLVYDHHNWIYAYGDLDGYIRTLERLGYSEGVLELSAPHTHNYHAENDAAEDAIFEYWEWLHFPMQEQDEY